ncbi:MAG: FecR domain-containing protein [Mucilaginibacter sp.]|uniref:FecR family protein n=1 Tax=Mucilaginibacter sp. TaxID=1882438 RepID=UPI0031A874D3
MSPKKPDIKQLQEIAAKVASGNASTAEKAFLDEYYDLFDHADNTHDLTEDDQKAAYHDIQDRLQQDSSRTSFFNVYSIAASVVMLLSLSIIAYKVLYNPALKDKAGTVAAKPRPIVYGSNKAVLTLANGKKITLDDQSAGTLARQAGTNVSKTTNGQLVYKSAATPHVQNNIEFNVMETPRGGIYQVYLPDGTRVWLNSASRLKYPVAFTGTERKVELAGEAYFEVSHNRQMPFIVISNNQRIEVLGTHFNVNAYDDELVTKTTLIQGSIKVTATSSGISKTIVPGQQAVLRLKGIQLHNVDTDNAIAWKTGLFRFDNEPLSTIMKKISRWYDVDIVYQDDVSQMRFGGTVSRFTDIQKVLSKLELTNTVHFKIEGRSVIVMK